MNWHRIDRLLRPWGPRRITAGLPHTEISLESVKEGIWPLVQALNRIDGVRTIASCHGHRRLARAGFDLVPWIALPYVFFEGPATFALTLSEHIDDARWESKLNYYWQVAGATHPDLGQCITLKLIGRFYLRRKLAQDLAWLVRCVACEIRVGGNADVRGEPHDEQQRDDANAEVSTGPSPKRAEWIHSTAMGARLRDTGGKLTSAFRILANVLTSHRSLQESNRMKKAISNGGMISDSRPQQRTPALTSTERSRRFRERLLNEGAARVDLHLAPAVAKLLDKECSRTGETSQAAIHRLIEQALRTRKAGRA